MGGRGGRQPSSPGRAGTRFDCVVVGLGVLGAACAEALARAGLRVLGLDRYEPPHELGSSHGRSRILRLVYAEGAAYVPLARRALAGWRRLESTAGAHLFTPGGGLTLGRPDGELVAGALRSARRHGLEHEVVPAAALAERFPQFAPPSDQVAVWDPAAGVLAAERSVAALLGAARAAGAELRLGTAAAGWRSVSGGVEVEAGGALLSADHLVLSAGPWLGELDAGLGAALRVARQVQHWLRTPGRGFAAPAMPLFVWEHAPGRIWYGLPDQGDGLKVAIHHGGAATTPDGVERSVAAGEIAEVAGLVARYLPAAAGAEHLAARVCLYTNTPDLDLIAGPLPGRPAVWALGGGSGHGFKFAPALGELVAESIVSGGVAAELRPFDPGRWRHPPV